MLGLVTLGLFLVSASGLQLPDLHVHHHDGSLYFRMPHVPGLKELYLHYNLGAEVNNVIPKVEKFIREGEEFVVKVSKVFLEPGQNVHYSVEGKGREGKVSSPLQHWVYAPVPDHNERKIRAVTFRDDFNGGTLDRNNWDIEVSMYGGYNWEFQVYTPETYNVHTGGGHLSLCPTFTTSDPRWDENWLHHGVMDMQQLYGQCTESGQYGCHREGVNGILPPVMSGKVKSRPTLQYGTLEIRARVPKGDWIWPAIWMMPRASVYGGWPRSGEIDIMETRGNTLPHGNAIDELSSTLHWGPSAGENHYGQTTASRHGNNDWSSDYHTWRLEWTHDKIETFVDNNRVLLVQPPAGGFGAMANTNIWAGHDKMAPFDQAFYAILNVAIGGTNGFFPDNWNYGTPKPWPNNSPHAAQDWWNARATWQNTWQGDKTCMFVDWIEFRTP